MKFPGSKLLHRWDLSTQQHSLDGLLKSCQQVGLTGFAEVNLPQGVGMILYYLGGEVNALFREGAIASHGQAALERLGLYLPKGEGSVSIYELPLDMAHLLRGVTNRRKLKQTLHDRGELAALLRRLAEATHTGALEVQTEEGSAMILLVRGRVSNTYWETAGGQTFEKGEARERLDAALDVAEGELFLSEFSREVWKTRHEMRGGIRPTLHDRQQATADQLVAEETALRNQVLDELFTQVPAIIQASIFDLVTGLVLASKGRGTEALRVGLLSEKLPAVSLYLRDLVAAEGDDHVELFELTTGRVTSLVATIAELNEAIAVLADKSMPTALAGAALSRSCRSYSERLRPPRPAKRDG